MTICCLGDLVLDVIVRLEQPLATGADATSRTVLRPGGQGANVAAWVAALGGRSRFVGKRGADDAGTMAAARLLELGVELAGPVEPDRERDHRLPRAPHRRAHDVRRPRRRHRAPTRRDRRGMVRRLQPPARLGLRAPARAGPVRRGRGDRPRARGRSPGERRPVLVERDPRPRRATGSAPTSRSSRPTSCSRTRTRTRSLAAPLPAAPGSSSGAPPAPRSTATSVQRSPWSRSTRRGRATPSPPAGSWAGRTSLSRPRRAACSRRDRCRLSLLVVGGSSATSRPSTPRCSRLGSP